MNVPIGLFFCFVLWGLGYVSMNKQTLKLLISLPGSKRTARASMLYVVASLELKSSLETAASLPHLSPKSMVYTFNTAMDSGFVGDSPQNILVFLLPKAQI